MSTDRAVEYVRSATLAEASTAAADHVRARTLDTLTAATAGYRMPGVELIRAYALDLLGGDRTTPWDKISTPETPVRRIIGLWTGAAT